MWLEKSTPHTGGDPRPEAHGQVPPSPPQEACRWYLCLSSLFPQSVSQDPPGMPPSSLVLQRLGLVSEVD